MNYPLNEYANMFKALSDETRLGICMILSQKEACGCEILEVMPITQPTLSYHMKILCDAGLTKGRKDGSWMRYTINEEGYTALQGCINRLATGPPQPTEGTNKAVGKEDEVDDIRAKKHNEKLWGNKGTKRD